MVLKLTIYFKKIKVQKTERIIAVYNDKFNSSEINLTGFPEQKLVLTGSQREKSKGNTI